MSDLDPNSPASSGPLGGRAGATIVAIVPIVAVILFFVFGFQGGWAWSWIFFLLIPLVGIIVYGPGRRGRG